MKKEEFYFQWHFMNSCNLRCSHCYQEGYHYEDMPWEKLMIIANQITTALRKWNMLGRISLTGGEPFLSPHLLPLVDYLEKFPEIKQFDILTNGTCITQEHIEALKQCRKLHQIQISIDGPIAEVHDAVRGPGTFDKVRETIRCLRENHFEVSFMFTLMRKNMDFRNVVTPPRSGIFLTGQAGREQERLFVKIAISCLRCRCMWRMFPEQCLSS